MKRFFIFAAMLAALTLRAADTQDDPPLILPDPETIILVPNDMFDIDRSIPTCEYTYDISKGIVYVSCHGTGQNTLLFLEDQTGMVLDMVETDAFISPNVTLHAPLSAGTYRIVLHSEKYSGEDYFIIR